MRSPSTTLFEVCGCQPSLASSLVCYMPQCGSSGRVASPLQRMSIPHSKPWSRCITFLVQMRIFNPLPSFILTLLSLFPGNREMLRAVTSMSKKYPATFVLAFLGLFVQIAYSVYFIVVISGCYAMYYDQATRTAPGELQA